MSEERDKRDGQSGIPSTPDSSPSDPSPSESSTSDTPAPSAGVVRPSGKRTARRARTGSSDSSADKVSITKAAPARTSVATRSDTAGEPKRMNIFKRLSKFLREVIAELRKVIWPNRKQMVTYTSVVLVFVAFMVAFISGADLAFIRGIEWLFG
ncbi:MAG: preprotein translocase subunit SecE [Rhodococcus sp. (in: high G+C Gram-positive bacteria)]